MLAAVSGTLICANDVNVQHYNTQVLTLLRPYVEHIVTVYKLVHRGTRIQFCFGSMSEYVKYLDTQALYRM